MDDVKNKKLAGKAVMNMSLGGSLSQAVNRAIQALSASGIVPVVAAGNENVSSQFPTRSLCTIVLNSLQIHSANSKMRPTPRPLPPPPPLPLAPLMPKTIPRPVSQTLAPALTFLHPESGSSVLASSRTRTQTHSAELAWVRMNPANQTLCHNVKTLLLTLFLASPHIAGLAAYLISLQGLNSPAQVDALMKNLADQTGARVQRNVQGTTSRIANNGGQ